MDYSRSIEPPKEIKIPRDMAFNLRHIMFCMLLHKDAPITQSERKAIEDFIAFMDAKDRAITARQNFAIDKLIEQAK